MAKENQLNDSFFDIIENAEEDLPRNEIARLAVLRSREIVRRNNLYISKIKQDSNIKNEHITQENIHFSNKDPYAFALYKIKSKMTFKELIKEILRFLK